MIGTADVAGRFIYRLITDSVEAHTLIVDNRWEGGGCNCPLKF